MRSLRIPEFYSGSINARYSGLGKSGICICGCRWDEHHLGIVMNEEYRTTTGESYVPQECEAFGFNEHGGMKYENGEWINHCQAYKDRGV